MFSFSGLRPFYELQLCSVQIAVYMQIFTFTPIDRYAEMLPPNTVILRSCII